MTLASALAPLHRWRAALNRDTGRTVWRRVRKPLAWTLGGYLLLQGVLALAVPWAVRGPALSAGAEALGRPVAVDRVRFNPFKLALSVEGLRVQDTAPSTETFVNVKRLWVDLSASSLWRWAPVIDHLHVDAPRFQLTRGEDGRFDIADLLQKLSDRPPAPPDAPPARFALHDLVVHGGEVHVEDRQQRTHHAVQQIEFKLPYVASFKGEHDTAIKPLLSAQVHGGELRLGAETKPFTATRATTLHLTLKGLNLASALKGLPALAPWQVEQGTLDTQWQLTLRAAEPGAGGATQTEGLTVLAKAQVQLHRMALSNRQGDRLAWQEWHAGSDQLTVHLHPDGLQWQVAEGQLGLRELSWRDAPQAVPALALSTLKVTQLKAGSRERVLGLGQVRWDGLQVQAHRAADGQLNLLAMLNRLPTGTPAKAAPVVVSSPAQPASAASTASAPSALNTPTTAATPVTPRVPAAPTAPWQVDVAQVRLSGTGAQWHDEAAKPVVKLGVKNLEGEVDALSTRPDAPALRYRLQTELDSGGTLAFKGTAQPGPRTLATEVQLTGLNLALAQPYLAQALKLQLSKGRLDVQGQLNLEAPANAEMRLGFKGQAAIDELYTREPDTQDDFLRWKRLAATDIDIAVAPLALSAKDRVRIGQIALQDLYAKVVINPAGRINLQDILRMPAKPAASARAPSPPEAAPTSAASKPTPQGPQIEIGGIKIAGGRLNFSDQFVKPNYTANITDLKGTVSAVGTKSPPAQLALQGRVEGDAPITIQGQLDPLGDGLFADITAKARGIDLPTLSPYSTKYAGYPIQRGKLSLEVHYRIQNGKLEADNNVFLDQLTFGERVDSPTATELPVLFAVSLLKNSRGEINLRLPVSGSLNDPQFSLGEVLKNALGNLLQRAVTAPFRLLASMFGGGSAGDFSAADFTPGTAELTAESLPRLAKLSQALVERPALRLDITAHVDPVAELGALRRARLMAQLQAERAKANPTETGVDADPVRWGERDYTLWLQRVYDSASLPGKPRNLIGVSKKIPVADMESLLMAATVVSDDEWYALAQERARAVRKALTEQVPSERVFTLAPVIQANAQSNAPTPQADPSAEKICTAACAAFSLH
ncbi:MAG: DUF748 domain-containing protein [Pseudomonadota bacterium]